MIVKLNVKNKVLFNYLAYLFHRAPDGAFQVTMKNDFGRLVVAFVRRSSVPIVIEESEYSVCLRLPRNTLTQSAEYSHLYFTAQDAARLNVLLDTIFDLDLNAYYQKGCKKKIQKREIIEAFVVSRKLFIDDFAETIGKRIYREQLKEFRDLVTALYDKARYTNDRIEGPNQPTK